MRGRHRREVLFVVNLFSHKIYSNVQIQCRATGHTKRVQKLFVKRINSHHLITQTGGGMALESLFGRGRGFAAMPADHCKPFSISN